MMTETTHHSSAGGMSALATLATWGALWRRGACAPDDVVDALADAAASHRVGGGDPVAAAALGFGAAETGSGSLLRALRAVESARLLLPAPGDTCGLTGPALEVALGPTASSGQMLVLWPRDAREAVGLHARTVAPGTVTWTAHRVGSLTPAEPDDLGAVEYELRQAIRDTTELYTGLGSVRDDLDPTELRTRLAALVDAEQIEVPPAAGDRIRRVLEQSARIAAIVSLVAERVPASGVTAAAHSGADAAMERLRTLVRTARMSAVNTAIAGWERPSN